MLLADIEKDFNDKKILGFKGKSGKKYILYFSGLGNLCYYKNSSKSKGFIVDGEAVDDFESIIPLDKETEQKAIFKNIEKYRKLAHQNLYTNDWLEKCTALPETYERWKKHGRKTLLDYGIVKVLEKVGKVISVEALRKEQPELVSEFFQNYENDEDYYGKEGKFGNLKIKFGVNVFKDDSVEGELCVMEPTTMHIDYYYLINKDTFIWYSSNSIVNQ